ncbi:antimicrobial peptide ABC transporter permease SapC [Alishewanella longhuensis]
MSNMALHSHFRYRRLRFFRLRRPAPTAEWGAMISDSLDIIYVAPVSVAVPGLLIFAAVLSVNLLGDGLKVAIQKRRESYVTAGY